MPDIITRPNLRALAVKFRNSTEITIVIQAKALNVDVWINIFAGSREEIVTKLAALHEELGDVLAGVESYVEEHADAPEIRDEAAEQRHEYRVAQMGRAR